MTPHKCTLNHKNGGRIVTGMDVSLCEGEYSCIHSVFNQWIKMSIYSSIDVSYDNCLSMLSSRRDTRGLSIIRQLKLALRGRGGRRHMNLKCWIHAARSITPLPQWTLTKRESISVRKAQVLRLCESFTWLFPCNGS